MSNDWIKQEYSSKGYGEKYIKRVLYVDNIENPKYKFKEEIDFIGENDEKPYAICIGLNPAKAQEELDVTNKRLINLLQNNYSGYYLFNIYPEITENATQINLEDNENINFVSRLKDILEEEIYKDLDVVLFFGRTLVIPDKVVELIRQWLDDKKKIYLTSHNGEFTHPGANAKIEKIELKSKYFRENTSIRIKK